MCTTGCDECFYAYVFSRIWADGLILLVKVKDLRESEYLDKFNYTLFSTGHLPL